MKEVCIIGGGIIGLCTAFKLHEAGLSVTVIDRGDFSSGCSFGNAGMLVPSHFIPLASPGMMAKGIQWMFQKKSPFYIRPRLDADLLRWLWLFDRSSSREHVVNAAPVLRDMHQESKEFYQQLHARDDFDFAYDTKGILMLYQTEETEQEEEEIADTAYTLGIDAKKLSHTQLQQLERGTSIDARGGIHYTGDAHLHPERLMDQIITYLRSKGVEFLAGHHVTGLNDKETYGCEIVFESGEPVQTKQVVVACGSWSSKILKNNKWRLPLQDGKGYSMTFGNLPRKPSIPSILVDARVAITPMGQELRVSGTLEISGMDDKIRKPKVESILSAVPDYYPSLKLSPPGNVWYGYRPCSPDGMPYVGRWSDLSSIVIATGHAMMGLSLAPATGSMIRDTIMRKTLRPLPLLKPSRFA